MSSYLYVHRVASGRINFVGPLRVFEIGIALDQNAAETVTVTVGAARPEFRYRIVKAIEKIKARPR